MKSKIIEGKARPILKTMSNSPLIFNNNNNNNKNK